MVVAACDARVGAVVAQIPNVSRHRNAPLLLGQDGMAEVRRRSAKDRAARLAGGDPEMVAVFATEPHGFCALPPAVDADYIQGLENQGTWRNTVTLRSLEYLMDFKPAGWVPFVAPKPLLMVLGEHDTCTFADVQREVFATAGEPKKLVVHPGGHFDTYSTHLHIAGYAARDWFIEHMPVRRPSMSSRSPAGVTRSPASDCQRPRRAPSANTGCICHQYPRRWKMRE
jgi:fermentation-respiration switch protein FrsA (DUF1100 family)